MRRRQLTWALGLLATALAAWLGLPGPDGPQTAPTTHHLRGRVTAVADGDTVDLLVGSQTHRVRLGGIDAPESDQAHGTVARAALAWLCLGRTANLNVEDTDRYGRLVGQLRCQDEAVNARLVQQGHAWVSPAYNRDPALPALEARAKHERLGLWAQPHPTPPWTWRQVNHLRSP